MSEDLGVLNALCPMHLVVSETGHIAQVGPTLSKLGAGIENGARFLELFEVYRPRRVLQMQQLLSSSGRKLHLRLRGAKRVALKGVAVPAPSGGIIINLSFGIGVVDAVREFSLSGKDFSPTDLAIEMLYLVEAKSAAMAASRHLNTRLKGAMAAAEQQAFTDTLTGLRNRRAMEHVLNRLGQNRSSYVVMNMDLDYFKKVNDSYGHAAGDYVLQCVSAIMVEATRKDDTVARLGGDEFVIIIPAALSPKRMSDLASRLIKDVEKPILHQGQECHVSLSIGISFGHPDSCDPAKVLEQADIALYESKRKGKAQFSFFEPVGPVLEKPGNEIAPGE